MAEEKKEREIELHSDEIEEILGNPPGWILRRGIFVIGIVLAVLFVGTFIFHYPDIIQAPVVITSENPPSLVVARSGGRIMSFIVKNNQQVTRGDYLAVLENPSDYSSISNLKKFFLKADSAGNTLPDLEPESETLTHLGDLQEPYLAFIKSLQDYKRYKSLALNENKIARLEKQIRYTEAYINTLSEQKQLQEGNLNIALSQFKRDTSLFAQKVLTPAEFENSQSLLISAKTAYKDSELKISGSQIEKSQLEQEVIELQLNEEKDSKQYFDEINNNYRTLKSQFDSWELAYVLKSTTSGKVSIGNYWSENQVVKAGDVIMSIVPDEKKEPFGKITLPMQGSGKVKNGLFVNIKMAGFPYMEYGMIRGKVKSISPVPDQGRYYVEIELPEGLTTNYGKVLPFNQEMDGTADIITEDMKLIERIFSPLRSLYTEKVGIKE
jgi:HlyD family secretion protein